MISKEENDLLCRTGPGTPMGGRPIMGSSKEKMRTR